MVLTVAKVFADLPLPPCLRGPSRASIVKSQNILEAARPHGCCCVADLVPDRPASEQFYGRSLGEWPHFPAQVSRPVLRPDPAEVVS